MYKYCVTVTEKVSLFTFEAERVDNLWDRFPMLYSDAQQQSEIITLATKNKNNQSFGISSSSWADARDKTILVNWGGKNY